MLTRSNKRVTVERRGCRCLLYASLILKQLVFIYFSSKRGVLDQTFSFKNEELIKIKKNADTILCSSFLETLYKNFKANGQAVLALGLGEHGNLCFSPILHQVHC